MQYQDTSYLAMANCQWYASASCGYELQLVREFARWHVPMLQTSLQCLRLAQGRLSCHVSTFASEQHDSLQ